MSNVLVIDDHSETGGNFLVPRGILSTDDLHLLSTVVYTDVYRKKNFELIERINHLRSVLSSYRTASRVIEDVYLIVTFEHGF